MTASESALAVPKDRGRWVDGGQFELANTGVILHATSIQTVSVHTSDTRTVYYGRQHVAKMCQLAGYTVTDKLGRVRVEVWPDETELPSADELDEYDLEFVGTGMRPGQRWDSDTNFYTGNGARIRFERPGWYILQSGMTNITVTVSNIRTVGQLCGLSLSAGPLDTVTEADWAAIRAADEAASESE